MKRLLISTLFALLITCSGMAQPVFLGFSQTQCGLLDYHGYSFSNHSVMCGNHTNGYRIYKNNTEIYQKCIYMGYGSALTLFFINHTTGFLIAKENEGGLYVYKTTNSGVGWTLMCNGWPDYLGSYLVNDHTGYLVSLYKGAGDTVLHITRYSEKGCRKMGPFDLQKNEMIQDTIWGTPYCADSLDFKVVYRGNTLTYNIRYTQLPLSVQELRPAKLVFFPNPVSDFLELLGDAGINFDAGLSIIQALGKPVRQYTRVPDRFYIGDLAPGLYFIEITVDEKLKRYKFLKQ